MKYQLIRTADNFVLVDAKRINDSYLVQEVEACISFGCFEDGIVKLFRDGVEFDPGVVIDKDESRYEKWLARKQETHKLIAISTGVCCLPQNRRKIWVPK